MRPFPGIAPNPHHNINVGDPDVAGSFEIINNAEDEMTMNDIAGQRMGGVNQGNAVVQPSFKNSFSMAASLKQLNRTDAEVKSGTPQNGNPNPNILAAQQ